MRDLLLRGVDAGITLGALAWLLVVEPLDLAATLSRLSSGDPARLGSLAVVLIWARVASVAMGLILGRHLLQRDADSRALAIAWAATDLATLACVLATNVVPSNRVPGAAPWIWTLYAVAAGWVLLAVRRRSVRGRSAGV